MAGRKYVVPEGVDHAAVMDLTPETKAGTELLPTTLVTCINRGPKTIRDMFDAQVYEIPPYAQFRVMYEVAAHIQRRNIVPGTRNPDPTDSTRPQFVPWIAIIGLDPEDTWQPFTDQELEAFGESLEGLDRSGMTAGNRAVTVVSTDAMRRQIPGAGVTASADLAMERGARGRQQVEGSAEAVDAALAKVEGSDAVTEALAAAGAGHELPKEEDLTVRSAPKPTNNPGKGKGKGR